MTYVFVNELSNGGLIHTVSKTWKKENVSWHTLEDWMNQNTTSGMALDGTWFNSNYNLSIIVTIEICKEFYILK